MDVIGGYLPDLNDEQLKAFSRLPEIYRDWNNRINLISRKDISSMEVRHILHSLALAKFIQSDQPLTIADIGSGGGFPGIPLCIVFPQHNFVLVESIKKKCMVISNVVESLNLQNVQVLNQRAEECTMKSDLIVSRAVARAVKLINWTRKMRKRQTDYVCLKGGDLNGERDELWTTYPKATWTEYLISEYFNDPFFETKKIIKISGV